MIRKLAAVAVAALAAGCGSTPSKNPVLDVSPPARAMSIRFANAVAHRDLGTARSLMRGRSGQLAIWIPIMNRHSAKRLLDRGQLKPCASSGNANGDRCFVFRIGAVARTRVYGVDGKLLRIERRPLTAHVLVEVARDTAGRFVSRFVYSEDMMAS